MRRRLPSGARTSRAWKRRRSNATASQSRAKEPLYDLIVSWAEGERPTYEQARAALDTQIEHLGFDGLLYVPALQNDGVGGLSHVHAVVQPRHPITHVARDVWQDRDKMRAASGKRSLSRLARRRRRQTQRTFARSARRRVLSKSALVRTPSTRRRGPGAARSGYPRRGLVGRRPSRLPRARRALRGGPSRPRRHQPRRPRSEHVVGGRICGSQPGNYARARDLRPDLTHRKLVERIGDFKRDREPRTQRQDRPFAERCTAAASDIAA